VLTFLWFDHQILSSLGLFGMWFQMVIWDYVLNWKV